MVQRRGAWINDGVLCIPSDHVRRVAFEDRRQEDREAKSLYSFSKFEEGVKALKAKEIQNNIFSYIPNLWNVSYLSWEGP